MTTAEAALRECPFCAGTDTFIEPSDFSSSYVVCNGCGARGPTELQESDEEDEPGRDAAIRSWDRRASPAPTDERKFYRSEWPLHKLLEARNGGLVTDEGEAWHYVHSSKDGTGGEYDLLRRLSQPSPVSSTAGEVAKHLCDVIDQNRRNGFHVVPSIVSAAADLRAALSPSGEPASVAVEAEPIAWRVDDLTSKGALCGSFALYSDYEAVQRHVRNGGIAHTKVTPLYPALSKPTPVEAEIASLKQRLESAEQQRDDAKADYHRIHGEKMGVYTRLIEARRLVEKGQNIVAVELRQLLESCCLIGAYGPIRETLEDGPSEVVVAMEGFLDASATFLQEQEKQR